MIFTTNRLQDIKKVFIKELAFAYTPNEINTFMALLCQHFIQLSKEEYILNDEILVNESDLLKFNFALKDLIKQKPIQYILSTTSFFGLDFIVSQDVLIPRPETEELVDLIIKENPLFKDSLLDIGTGSGCIAIALKNKYSDAKVTAIDVSLNALQIAKRNAVKNNVEIQFIQADISDDNFNINQHFSIIVSNPPYIMEDEKQLMKANVLDYEPAQALFVPNDNPLLFYKTIAEFAKTNLVDGGKLYFEINETLGDVLLNYLNEQGFINCAIFNDLFGKPRFIRCMKGL